MPLIKIMHVYWEKSANTVEYKEKKIKPPTILPSNISTVNILGHVFFSIHNYNNYDAFQR
jgi:hypothetical protein